MATNSARCQICHREGRVSACSQCSLVNYCGRECQSKDWKAGHKILCSKVPKAVKKAEEKIASFQLSDYTTRNVGEIMVTEAVALRGEIVNEHEAQDMCWNAMGMSPGSPAKLRLILRALELFPLSTEAWGMLGHFYQYEVTKLEDKKKRTAEAALEMYDNAILCARMLNPTWSEDRSNELPWGEIENRPYLRSLLGRATALKDAGKRKEAIAQAKKLLRLNPNDNQGVRKLLCTWFLEAGDSEGCTNLMRKFKTDHDTSMAYADVVLQYALWRKDDAVENDAKQALYTAIKANPFVPDLLGGNIEKDDDEEDSYYSPGDRKEARNYVIGSKKLWGRYPEVSDWVKSQKFPNGIKKPSESDLVDLLKSGTEIQIRCINTDLDGHDRKESTLTGTQKRSKCIGCALETFHWPRQLNRPHEISTDILVHNNDFHQEVKWRKTLYTNILEVPYWELYLQFYMDDPDDSDSPAAIPSPMIAGHAKRVELSSSLSCKICSSPHGRFCALDHDGTWFYCSKACMKDFLEESEPTFFDLQSQTLEVHASRECSINTISLDDAFCVAWQHMPNLNSVDIFIDQSYVLRRDYNYGSDAGAKKLLLSSSVLDLFLEKTKSHLVSFSFRLDDCCWEEFKQMTDRCRSLLPLGTMPNLKKLDLSNFGFDDMETLISCLSTQLQALTLNYVMIGPVLEWTSLDVNVFVAKLSQLKHLVSLSLANTKMTDHHLKELLPRLKSIRCLNLSGKFGNFDDFNGHWQLTDVGLKVIADNCPNILSLSVDDQPKITYHGIRSLIQKCHGIMELDLGYAHVNRQQIEEITSTLKKLLLLRVGAYDSQHSLENAVRVTEGRLVVCMASSGCLTVKNLSPAQKRNQNDSMAKLEKARRQWYDPMICNKWDGII